MSLPFLNNHNNLKELNQFSRDYYSKKIAIIFLLSTGLLLTACDSAGRSASMAFDNANSVIRTSSDKLFMATDVTPTPMPDPAPKEVNTSDLNK